MISRSNLDRLVGALALNNNFREAFADNRTKAIQEYNEQQRRQFRRSLDLNMEEMRLILSFPETQSLLSFIQSLENYIVSEGLALI